MTYRYMTQYRGTTHDFVGGDAWFHDVHRDCWCKPVLDADGVVRHRDEVQRGDEDVSEAINTRVAAIQAAFRGEAK